MYRCRFCVDVVVIVILVLLINPSGEHDQDLCVVGLCRVLVLLQHTPNDLFYYALYDARGEVPLRVAFN